jgi:hypothetical protein
MERRAELRVTAYFQLTGKFSREVAFSPAPGGNNSLFTHLQATNKMNNYNEAVFDLYSHWMEGGVGDRLAWGFAVFEWTIRHETSVLNRIRKTKSHQRDSFEVVILGFDRIEEEGLLRYQDWMLPLWVKFSEALVRASATSIVLNCLSIGHVELPRDVLEVLSPVMKVAPIKLLHLKNNGLSRAGINILTQIIRANRLIERVALKDSQLEIGSIVSLVEQPRHQHCVQSISLDKCNLGRHSMLMSALTNTLPLSQIKTISLAYNYIEGQGAEIIAAYLRTNPPLESIDLTGNLISDEGVVVMANALKTNTTLRGLRLELNPLIGMKGKWALCSLLYDVSTLGAIHCSNHVCQVTSDVDLPGCNRYISWNANRVSKILGVLYTEFAFAYLDEISLEMVPHVLAFVQYPSFKFSLSRTFHLVQGWDVPMTNIQRKNISERKRKRAVDGKAPTKVESYFTL